MIILAGNWQTQIRHSQIMKGDASETSINVTFELAPSMFGFTTYMVQLEDTSGSSNILSKQVDVSLDNSVSIVIN